MRSPQEEGDRSRAEGAAWARGRGGGIEDDKDAGGEAGGGAGD